MAPALAFKENATYCPDDQTMLRYQLVKIERSRRKSEDLSDLVMSFHYCPTCKSYSTDQGMNKDPLEAARSFYRENPFYGKPEEVVGVEILEKLRPK